MGWREKCGKHFLSCRGTRKVNLVRFADDFIASADLQELLINEVSPIVENFVEKRGLSLSFDANSHHAPLFYGFDFLGFNVRKYKGKLLIKP